MLLQDLIDPGMKLMEKLTGSLLFIGINLKIVPQLFSCVSVSVGPEVNHRQ